MAVFIDETAKGRNAHRNRRLWGARGIQPEYDEPVQTCDNNLLFLGGGVKMAVEIMNEGSCLVSYVGSKEGYELVSLIWRNPSKDILFRCIFLQSPKWNCSKLTHCFKISKNRCNL